MIKNVRTFNVEELRFNSVYQRVFEPSRCKEIELSIKKDGYWDHSVIVVNQHKEIVDGQHRCKAAIKCGIKRLTASVVNFESKEREAEFFWVINNYKSTHLKPKDYWFARHQSACPIASVLYDLNEKENSLLKNLIAIKGHDTKHKLPVEGALTLINYCCLGTVINWKRSIDDKIISYIKKIGAEEIVLRANGPIDFMFNSFGRLSKSNQKPYYSGTFRALLTFYKLIKSAGFSTEKTEFKMSKFPFTSEFYRLPQGLKIQTLVNWYNSGKTKFKIDYSL